MKRFSMLIFTITMLSLILMMGSCAPVVPATVGGGIVVQEASAGVLPMSGSVDEGRDSTAFLVGEFNGSNGSIARFNGHGDLTLIAADGTQSTGSYALTEYEKKQATVTIELPGAYCEYDFALCGGSGDFTLTDAAGNTYTFTPVIY